MERRNTIQREMVLEAVKSLKNHATADKIYAYIVKRHPTIGKGTVYRNLNILAEDGEVQRIEIPNGPDRFDHTLAEHYHVICERCNNVYDVDMNVLPDLREQIVDNHGMEFLGYEVLFRGICADCQADRVKEG